MNRPAPFHGFYVSAGLLTAEHFSRIGAFALWVFLWLISHETKTNGKVENGAAITAVRIAREFRVHANTVRSALNKLETEKYISRVMGASSVYSYRVENSKKWKQASEPETSAELLTESPAVEQVSENPKPRKTRQTSLIDSRHSPVRELILAHHEKTFPAAPKCPWDGRTGTVLKKILKANPSWKLEDIQSMIRNRFSSEGIAPDSPTAWLPKLSSYSAGPLNKFGRLEASKSNGKAPIGNALDYQRELLRESK